MSRKQILAAEAAMLFGVLVTAGLYERRVMRKRRLERENEFIRKANTLKDIDARIELAQAFNEIVKGLE